MKLLSGSTLRDVYAKCGAKLQIMWELAKKKWEKVTARAENNHRGTAVHL